jgi:hypothetical protein
MLSPVSQRYHPSARRYCAGLSPGPVPWASLAIQVRINADFNAVIIILPLLTANKLGMLRHGDE